MSDLERSDHGAMTESPTLLPGQSGHTRSAAEAGREVTEVTEVPEPVSPTEPNGSAPAGATDRPPLLDENGLPKKRRRRGSRGGRGRKKPGTVTGSAGPGTGEGGRVTSSSEDSRSMSGGKDWTDAAADRGLTAEDAGDQAREDAGLAERGAVVNAPRAPRPQAATPRVGDSRPGAPAPAPAGEDEAPAKKRRRRRGGRGRNKSGGADRVENPRPESPRPAAGGRKPATPRYVDAGLPLTDVDVDGTALLDSLDDETLLRRRGTHRKGRPAGRYLMVVHQRDDGIAHIAVLEGRTLVEHYVSMPTDDTLSIDGNIYLGRVQNVLPGMEAAFIDIGTPRTACCTAATSCTTRPMSKAISGRASRACCATVSRSSCRSRRIRSRTRARLTQEVSLAGRFVVMVPGQPQTYGISKRLPEDERKRLRQVLDRLRPEDAGLIVRTAAEGATEEELERDMLRLNEQWRQISEFAKKAKPGSLLYKEPPLAPG